MKREEIPSLNARLIELAEYYSSRPPTPAAAKVWFDCLEGANWADVQSVLTDWPKTQRNFPTGDQVRKLAAEKVSTRIEEEGKRNNALAPTVEAVLAKAAPSPVSQAFKRMYDAVYKRHTVESPRQWCMNVLSSDRAADSLKVFAEQSLERMVPEHEERNRRAATRWDMKEAA